MVQNTKKEVTALPGGTTDKEKLVLRTKLSSVGLHALDSDIAPIGSASGCIVKYKGVKFILTVSHATLEEGRWGIQLEYDVGRKAIKYYCPIFNFIAKGGINVESLTNNPELDLTDLISNPETIDLSYARIPDEIVAFDEYIDTYEMVKYFAPKIEIESSLDLRPTVDHKYSFYGHIRTVVDKQNKRILLTPKLILNMEYVCEYGDFYRFKLPEIIKDPADYQGCSGAPIIDEDGNLVSLVTSCYRNTNVLLGINLHEYKVALDIESGVI